MKVIFYCSANNSDVYEFPDDASELELFDAANEWAADNVGSWYEVIDEDNEYGEEIYPVSQELP